MTVKYGIKWNDGDCIVQENYDNQVVYFLHRPYKDATKYEWPHVVAVFRLRNFKKRKL